ncbi:hypothetical protein SAMN04487944_1309 [Gracilibacillus ureilyticus]|uniref:Uncharacterized protein n=1 Tax=Gracilibacillus ureilyticus TaxID=531814 RepID=A0A1H9VZ51_9BACI|nr:hypothetical protein [Gracilibacillus ureilyticus]SES26667.1 hypothetical protein SAMN04487944_1309 [Gracilibacillus ureilyticus]
MKETEFKKIITPILVVLILIVGAYFGYEYITDPKIVEGVVSKNIDDKGKPVDITTEFAPEDEVYFSAKRNRFWIKKAEIVWYKGTISTENRLLVEEEIEVNEAGYFSAKLSAPKGLEEGHYGVTIYVDDTDIIETKTEFDVKK